jgi:haloacetate dehalogenase
VSTADERLFPGFVTHRVRTGAAMIHCVVGGSGPALLLLHGMPQTHALWHKIAAQLAQTFTVVCADLRGYGDSSKPEGDPGHARYSKRAMALDMVETMAALGYPHFRLAGHDRGARVAHRLCLDHPAVVEQVAMLDASPTLRMFARSDKEFATINYHWYFFNQPVGFPERLIGADPVFFLRHHMFSWRGTDAYFDPVALAEYERCFTPATVHAMCEDYRAGAGIDLEHDRADIAKDQRIACPLLALWGSKGSLQRMFDPVADWSAVAQDVRGCAISSGHALAEEAPDETASALQSFFGRQ